MRQLEHKTMFVFFFSKLIFVVDNKQILFVTAKDGRLVFFLFYSLVQKYIYFVMIFEMKTK
jgi:hypothetical protein